MNLVVGLILTGISVYVLLEIRSSIFNRYLKKAFEGGLILLLVFAGLKIMHWPGANLLLPIAATLLLVTKATSMARQKPNSFDYIMLLWLFVYLLAAYVRIMHCDIGIICDYLIAGAQIVLLIAVLSRSFFEVK